MKLRLSSALLAAALFAPSAFAQRAAPLPTPASILGYEPGADRHLPTWKQITDYFTALDKASPRVQTRVLGKTTLGRPFLAVFISDSSTLANLEHYRQIQRKLMDPRLQAPGERQKLLDEGKNVILVTSAIHSNEVGGYTTPLNLADRLARAADPEAKAILANTIIILVPSQNPDGVDIVGDYYRSTLGTPKEGRRSAGAVPQVRRPRRQPRLVRVHAGRDALHGRLALHAVGSADRQRHPPAGIGRGPHLHSAVHGSGRAEHRSDSHRGDERPRHDMVWRMTNQGFTGIASNAAYDQWSPARQYSLYHRGARLLTETASARARDADRHSVRPAPLGSRL